MRRLNSRETGNTTKGCRETGNPDGETVGKMGILHTSIN